MAKFITTKQISSELEILIQEADKTLYLVSPFLKLSKDFQELIKSRNLNEKKTVIIYGKYELTPEQLKFLTGLRTVFLKFHENLHAKCYINDTKLIITSLNFYEYSMLNNKEIGVLYDTTIEADKEIYTKCFDHVKFIEQNSNDKPFELDTSDTQLSPKGESKIDKSEKKKTENSGQGKKYNKPTGYCIRTGVKIPFNIEKPYSSEGYKLWNKDVILPERYCHFSGEASNGKNSFKHPVISKNWKLANEIFGLINK